MHVTRRDRGLSSDRLSPRVVRPRASQIKPLTEEEKKEKLAELRAKMAAKRAVKAEEDAKEAKENAKLRRKQDKVGHPTSLASVHSLSSRSRRT